jgi:hypothetical protein
MGEHLKSHQHYIDLYDRHTVERCRRIEKSWDQDDAEELPEVNGKKLTRKETEGIRKIAHEWYFHIVMGEEYLNKDRVIREWMDADRQRDQLYESAQAPEGIRCLTCRNLVKPTFKEVWSQQDKPDRVLFMFDCKNNCVPRRAFFSDGEEWRVKPDLCPKCSVVLNKTMDDDGEKLLTTFTCPTCSYTSVDEYIWTHKEDEGVDENFAKDRDRFCMTEEDGRKYRQEKFDWERLGKFAEEWKKEDEARAEKLKANPKGFHLDGAGYTCFICGDHTPEGDNWYDEYGIKCLVCQKAIDEGEIPASLAKDKDSWYSKFDLSHYFNLKGTTLRKWVKDGIIKSRTVSHYGNGVHTELFLLEDNEGFLPPKKLVESRSVRVDKGDGQDWHTMQNWYEFNDPHTHLKGYKIMEHMRIIPPEEMKAREEEKKRKWEEKQARKEIRRKQSKK